MAEKNNKHSEVKTIITSILTSTPLQSTVQQLQRDYHDMIGEPIPFMKLGYTNIFQYLNSISDAVKILGNGPHALLQVVVTEKSAHINKLICKQRVPVKRKRGRHQLRPRTQSFSSGYNAFIRNSISYMPKPGCYRNDQNTHKITEKQQSEAKMNFIVKMPAATSTPSCSYNKKPLAFATAETFTSSDEDEMFYSGIDEEEPVFERSASPPERGLFATEDDTNYRVPHKVQENLKTLIAKYPDGIWCAKIPDAYKQTFGSSIDYAQYGYRSLVQLCADLGRLFHFVRPDKGDYKLYDCRLPVPKIGTSSITESSCFDDNVGTAEEALPYVGDILKEKAIIEYPPDAVKYGAEMEKQWIPSDFNLTEYIDLNVAEVYDPSKFWVIIRSEDCSIKLDQLMDNMQLFYNQQTNYCIPESMIKVGMYCSAMFCNEYHRAIIVSLQNEMGKIKLFFLDYGTVASFPPQGVCFLHRDFFALPQQAIRARLVGIYPPTTDTQWTRESAARFLNLVFQKNLVALIQRIDHKRGVLELVLADTTSDEDIFINDVLVNEGFAIFTSQDQKYIEPRYKPIVKYIHLFPTFVELEYGLVPTATEKLLLREMHPNVLYPQYYETFYEREPAQKEVSDEQKCRVHRPAGVSLANTDQSLREEEIDITPVLSPAESPNPAANPQIPEEKPLRPPPGFPALGTAAPRNFSETFLPPQTPPSTNTYLLNQYLIYYQSQQIIAHNYLSALLLNSIANTSQLQFQPQSPSAIDETESCISQLQKLTLNDATSPPLTPPINCNANILKPVLEARSVNAHEFKGKTLHVIHYQNDAYFIVSEVVPHFAGAGFPIRKIRKILAKGYSVPLIAVDTKQNPQLKRDLLRFKLMEESDRTINLVAASNVPKLVRILTKKFDQLKEYDAFLSKIKTNPVLQQSP